MYPPHLNPIDKYVIKFTKKLSLEINSVFIL